MVCPNFFDVHIAVEGWEMSELGIILAFECGILSVAILGSFSPVQTE
jgi:hypothetical protein